MHKKSVYITLIGIFFFILLTKFYILDNKKDIISKNESTNFINISDNQNEQTLKVLPEPQKFIKLYEDIRLINDITNNPPQNIDKACLSFCLQQATLNNNNSVGTILSYNLANEEYVCECYKPEYKYKTSWGNTSFKFKKESFFKWECYIKTDKIEFEVCLCSKEEDQQTHDACFYETAKKWNQKEICNSIIREWVKNNCFELFK